MSHEDKARDDLENVERDIVEALYGANWTPQAVRDLTDRLHATISTALRQAADTWYRIDDPEHPAPKDGTPVLISNGEYVGEVRWCDDEGHEGWYWLNVHWTDGVGPSDPLWDATHWRPLPPPPSDKGNSL